MVLSTREDLIAALVSDETRDSAMIELYAIIDTAEKLIKMGMYTPDQVDGLNTRITYFHEKIAQATNPNY